MRARAFGPRAVVVSASSLRNIGRACGLLDGHVEGLEA